MNYRHGSEACAQRELWVFPFTVVEVLAAARVKYEWHQGRVQYWKTKFEGAQEAFVKENEASVRQTLNEAGLKENRLQKVGSMATSSQNTIMYGLSAEASEAQQKMNQVFGKMQEHRAACEVVNRFIFVLSRDMGAITTLYLTMDDVAYFRLDHSKETDEDE